MPDAFSREARAFRRLTKLLLRDTRTLGAPSRPLFVLPAFFSPLAVGFRILACALRAREHIVYAPVSIEPTFFGSQSISLVAALVVSVAAVAESAPA